MMTKATIAESRVFLSWQDYQEALKRAVAPLTDEQLGRRFCHATGRRAKSPSTSSLGEPCIWVEH